MQNLVIVESPTKARTLQKYLGDQYQIEASMGHVRDLPKSDFGVDVEHDFEPQYVIPRDKRKMVNQLKKVAELAKNLWLATDPDREGEAIAWHLGKVISEKGGMGQEIKRVIFHEITEDAIKEAFKNPRQINLKLVDAQQARRVLDRLVGYKLSPLLWQKVKKGLSAGRVQSVALRLIVEREREISAFKAVEYWVIEAELSKHLRGETGVAPSAHLGGEVKEAFIATLIEQNGKKLAIKNEQSSYEKNQRFFIRNKEEADGHVANLAKASYVVSKITQKEVRRYPYPPFTTSTMQQGAANRLGFSAKKTMMLAQALYERGLITYMRTDSFNLAPSAIVSARNYIGQKFGKAYLPSAPRLYKSKSKNVQEAHEAIRVTDVKRQSSDIRQQGGLNRDHVRLYDLIWKRFLACQMSEAVLDQTTVDVQAHLRGEPKVSSGAHLGGVTYLLRATGSVIKFEGWLKLYGKEAEENEDEKKQLLPSLSENQPLNLIQLLPSQHFTEPPPRYTEATLIKKLEELGIGRPSTYAPILSTIQDRFYVEKQERKFVPTSLGFAVTDFVVKYFPDIVDYSFTAQLEDELDEIARGEREWRPTIREFYTPFEKKLEETAQDAEKVKMVVEYAGKKCPECGKELIVRIGKFGKFLACSGFPDCRHTESIEETINIKCPEDGGEIVVRKTRRGKTFYGCKNWPVCKFASWTKPKASKQS
ncbi:type I DNA topoisomerase [Candidatus Daviesbacteria bacterium]|nr:type I DNA topoisomerase [Candidatus Daviesbacteria bacterium]MBI4035432.1 type I DNA topoisomerase [Candidatus Daviesbacteria bacterium]